MKLTAFDRETLKNNITDSVVKAFKGRKENPDLYSNTLDCFSAVVDCVILNVSIDDWMDFESQRQTQKTLQNIMGKLHEKILMTSGNWESLGAGGVVDLVCHEKNIIAEIKNKHNTTKGNHKVAVYDDLNTRLLLPEFKGYTGYYVEVLPPPNKTVYNIPFTPSDNKTNQRRPKHESIRKIDGRSFYALVTGEEGALDQVYFNLAEIVLEILYDKDLVDRSNSRVDLNSNSMTLIFERAYSKK